MQKIIRLGISAIALAFVLGGLSAVNTSAQGPLTEILNRMEAHRNSLDSLKANVKMTKVNYQIDETDTTEGKVIYLPQPGSNDYVRIDWNRFNGQPFEETLTVVKGSYVIYRPRLKQALCGDRNSVQGSGKANNALDFMSMSKSELKANYTTQWIGKESINGTNVAHIKLTPKKQSSYKSADLWVNADGMPIQARVFENNNDSTTIYLSGVQKNVRVSGKDFSVSLPKDVKCTKG